MRTFNTVRFEARDDGSAWLSLNRPSLKNAMNGEMYDEARAIVAEVERDPSIRLLVLSGEGTAFCAGGDFKYQQSQAERPQEERLAEASKLALWLKEMDQLSKPLIGRVHGAVYGGGNGLAAVCDIVVAASTARFCLSEVRLGLMPSMISPYVVKKIGPSNARSVFLSAREFDAHDAWRFGLVHEVVADAELDAAVHRHVQRILACAPGAIAETKRLVAHVAENDEDSNFAYTVALVARMWESAEAAEGIQSFLQKRKPQWNHQEVS